MKNQFLILLLILLCMHAQSQIVYENGYFINDNNEKTECIIKNIDWQFNPSEFEYKLSETSETQTASIRFVKEFGITNVSKYVRAKVNIDRSNEDIAKLNSNRNPEFKEEILFLKVLIEGNASLFIYEERELRRFFYQTNNSEINQLIYKSFLVNNKQIGYNIQFRQQLHNDLKCETISINDIKNLPYYKKELIRFFIDYNKCLKTGYVNFDEKARRKFVNLTIRPGANYSSLVIKNSLSSSHTDFEPKLSFRLGMEMELLMPFNKNKWAFIIEPTYQSFKSQSNTTYSVNYKSVELPLGIRHYFYLNEKSKVFLNSSIVIDFITNSTLKNRSFEILELRSFYNYAIGFGFKYNDRFSIELRYLTKRNILSNHTYWASEYKTMSFIMGYSFLRTTASKKNKRSAVSGN